MRGVPSAAPARAPRTTSAALPRTAVIGAGSSGIAALKALVDRGVPTVCFEASDRVGGNWVFGNTNGMSAAYRDLHINTSRERMAYADHPMPSSYPDFPHHAQIAAYFDDYVDRFGLREHVRFETLVRHARRDDDPTPGGRWHLELADGTVERFDALLVANGHHWDPRWPEPAFPGAEAFAGRQMHAHEYVSSDELAGKDVVVLGMGNSAMDIAVEASYVARSTTLAARSGVWILPKYLMGRPVDQPALGRLLLLNPRIPPRVRHVLIQAVLIAAQGRPQDHGLPAPDHRFGAAHPTVSGRILDRLQHGTVTPRPTIARLHEREVEFVDGTRAPADVVVYCTGYKVSFPFFDEGFFAAPGNRVDLFHRVFDPEIPDLAFVCLLQPLGATMPLAEAQAKWIASWLVGEYALPSARDMRREMARDRRAMDRRYVRSARHTIQVDFDDYLHALGREREAGLQRARRRGAARPVPAVAQAAPA